jgi:hypothetical protein
VESKVLLKKKTKPVRITSAPRHPAPARSHLISQPPHYIGLRPPDLTFTNYIGPDHPIHLQLITLARGHSAPARNHLLHSHHITSARGLINPIPCHFSPYFIPPLRPICFFRKIFWGCFYTRTSINQGGLFYTRRSIILVRIFILERV